MTGHQRPFGAAQAVAARLEARTITVEHAKPEPVELAAREKGFVCRIMHKYPGGQHRGRDLYRSLAIFSALIVLAHVIEQLVPTRWLALVIILPPALFMFTRYRKFSIFRSCVLSKVGSRLAQYEDLTPPRGGAAHPHARRARSAEPPAASSSRSDPPESTCAAAP